uniref:Uncharacterized protein n=1 Tax=Anguilla anguilla TaxID=7936 RepID=A0A0E9SZU2_ANGAN
MPCHLIFLVSSLCHYECHFTFPHAFSCHVFGVKSQRAGTRRVSSYDCKQAF